MSKRATYKPNGDLIRILLAQKGMDLKTFARVTGYSNGWISLIVRNKRNVSPRTAKMVSSALDRSIDKLFTLEMVESK